MLAKLSKQANPDTGSYSKNYKKARLAVCLRPFPQGANIAFQKETIKNRNKDLLPDDVVAVSLTNDLRNGFSLFPLLR